MSLILRQVIGYQQGRKSVPTTTPSHELQETKNQLNSILKKWKFGDTPITTSQEFLNHFEPWINAQLEKQSQLKLFLAKKGVNNLKEAETKLTNRDLTENEELTTLKKELAHQEQTFKNTEEDYLARIEELLRTKSTGASPEDHEELITERDQLARDKGELEQETLSLNNKLKLKYQEVQNKEKTIENLKKDKDQQETNLNKKITELQSNLLNLQSKEKEKNGLITTLQREVNQLKEKYSKQGKLLDEEQLECKKLAEKVEELERKITQLETERRNLLEPQKTYQEWLEQGALNETITEGSWHGYTYAYASGTEASSFQDNPSNLTKKWKLEDLKEEIDNNPPY